MTLEQIAALGSKLISFLALFADCFGRRDARQLLWVYVKGQLSNLHRKTAEAIALRFKTAPRTLQRFLESIKWDEEKLRDRCQQIVMEDHAHPDAIGCVDESGTTKSGKNTVGVGRQWNGNRGKVDNCVVGVHLSYSAPGFQVLLDSTVYLPEDWANDPVRRKENYVPDDVEFSTKQRIALGQVDHALSNGVRVSAWTFDEFYGRDRKFLDGLESRRQVFAGEIPSDFHGWVQKPTVLRTGPKKRGKGGRAKRYPRVARRRPSCEVRNLVKYSPIFRDQSWQRYRVKDTDKGPEVWEVKWSVFWRKDEAGLPTRRHCLIVARNVRELGVRASLAISVDCTLTVACGQSFISHQGHFAGVRPGSRDPPASNQVRCAIRMAQSESTRQLSKRRGRPATAQQGTKSTGMLSRDVDRPLQYTAGNSARRARS